MVSDTPIDLPNINAADTELVELQLKKVLSSSHFKSAKQMQRFLQYIIDKSLYGKDKELKQYTIAVEALGFSDDFDSDSNPSVRILGGRVRERLKKYYEGIGSDDPIVLSIPKGAYIPLIYKKPTQKVSLERHHCEEKSYGPKLALVGFTDKTQNTDSNQLLYQISDSLAKELSHFIFLRLVVSIPHADKDQSSKAVVEVKDKYKAEYVMSLYVQQLPDNKHNLLYRIMDSDLEEVLWSESFAVKRGQLESEQQEIIGKITAVVADILQGLLQIHWARKQLAKNSIPSCYQTLAYYRYFLDDLSRGAFNKAIKYCAEALQRNPISVIANVIYAEYCRRDYSYGYGIIENPLEQGKKCAELAIRYHSESHEAHFALAQILFCTDDWEHSIEEFNIARKITKYHTVIEYGTGFYFCMMGRWDEGLNLVKKAMSLTSAYPSWYHLTPFLNYYRQEKYKEALSEANKIISPNILHGPLARCVCYAYLDNPQKAKSELEEVIRRFPTFMETGKHHLTRFLGSEEFANKVWKGVEIVSKRGL